VLTAVIYDLKAYVLNTLNVYSVYHLDCLKLANVVVAEMLQHMATNIAE